MATGLHGFDASATTPPLKHRSRRKGHHVAAALGLAFSTGAALVCAANPAAAADYTGSPDAEHPHCTRTAYSDASQSMRCFATLREAIGYGTSGRVEDAPGAGAGLLDNDTWKTTLAKINTAGDAARTEGGDTFLIAGIIFDQADFGGYSITMATSPTFNNTAPCAPGFGGQWTNFWADGFTPRSVATFNHCYYWTQGVEWYANDRARSIDSPTIPTSPSEHFVSFHRGPTRSELLSLCKRAFGCKFSFDQTSTPTPSATYYGGWEAYDGILNCSVANTAEDTLSSSKTVGGSVSVGTEVEVSASSSFFGAQISAAFSTTFNQTWNWETTLTHSISVTVPAGQWGALYGRPLWLDYKGKYELRLPFEAWGHQKWVIKDVTVSRPADKDQAQWKLLGGPIVGSPYESECSSETAGSGNSTLPDGWTIHI